MIGLLADNRDCHEDLFFLVDQAYDVQPDVIPSSYSEQWQRWICRSTDFHVRRNAAMFRHYKPEYINNVYVCEVKDRLIQPP